MIVEIDKRAKNTNQTWWKESRNRLSFLLVMCVFSVFPLFSGQVRLVFPVHADKPVVLMLKNGTRADTVYTGRFDASGTAVINVPERFAGYAGMGRMVINSQVVFEFVVNKENFSLECKEEYPHGDIVKFTGSPENTALQTWFKEQVVRKEKLGMLKETERVYHTSDAFYSLIEQECRSLEKEQSDFEALLEKSPLYTARFMRFRNLMDTRIAPLVFADSLQMASMRKYATDSLDIENLYTSGIWFEVLNGLLAIYDNAKPYHQLFIEDMSQILSRIKSLDIYTSMAADLFSICESTGWNDLEEQLVYFLVNDGRIKKHPERLQQLLTRMKLIKGGKAPALTQCTLPKGKVLLAFYQSGCGPCEQEMLQLIESYQRVTEKGFEVITLSSDTDADVFRNFSRTFPWKDKYCDFQSFSGADFKNYGITSAPTFFVINKGIIVGRYARLKDTCI
ncbi:MAG: TlpA family protein disulfide reductase [Dysgonamonadaceae bacterium]|jgi:thiol-disulfide isomerase/thioredoxin|nr:TlpA family protein disulfide reductase [Dysgonamonadaceae bacterium]